MINHYNQEVRFATFQAGGFITAIVVNPPERKLAKRTSVCIERSMVEVLNKETSHALYYNLP